MIEPQRRRIYRFARPEVEGLEIFFNMQQTVPYEKLRIRRRGYYRARNSNKKFIDKNTPKS